MTQRVVLDTNILVANFNPSNSLRLLLDGARSAQIVLIVPELVIREASNKYREQLEAKLRELEKVRPRCGASSSLSTSRGETKRELGRCVTSGTFAVGCETREP